MPASLLWWILAACVFVFLPAALAFVGDEPDNAVVHEQESAPGQDPDETLMSAA